ncbi:jg8755 [Pararge aegeria aegeria]|uniref:Jg8755 protein n=1 Tax=Pararge aegeria aegeria TaxID=348720 RepID=A0A8S4S1E0_9NEOP|nr:jg8755 [Pararge aegeria aegeria]
MQKFTSIRCSVAALLRDKTKKVDCEGGIDLATSSKTCSSMKDTGKRCCDQCMSGKAVGRTRGATACTALVHGKSGEQLLAGDAFTQCCKNEVENNSRAPSRNTTTVSKKLTEYDLSPMASVCEEYAPNELCAHHCIPIPGAYKCECNPGFMLMADGRNCREVTKNRCKPHNPCQHKCNDNGVSVKCSCRRGYQLMADGKSCEDIDECVLDPPVCLPNTKCFNIVGSYKCIPIKNGKSNVDKGKCPSGFTKNLANNACDDINECNLPSPPCPSYICENTIGGYKCGGISGDPGSMPSKPKTPVEDGCPPGFISGFNEECEDIDECALGKDDCNKMSQFCINIRGSFHCQDKGSKHCPPGFKTNSITNKCEDINECDDGQDICRPDQICVNVLGEYDCKAKVYSRTSSKYECPDGMRKNKANSLCEDIDECTEGTHLCDLYQNCLNTNGSHECHCIKGFELDPKTRACTDINECATDLNNCIPETQRCDNTVGSFLCIRFLSCGTGYTLHHSTSTCEDIDECALGIHNCARAGPEYQCLNLPGSFRCQKPTPPEYDYDEYYEIDEEVDPSTNETRVITTTTLAPTTMEIPKTTPVPITIPTEAKPEEPKVLQPERTEDNSIDNGINTNINNHPEKSEPEHPRQPEYPNPNNENPEPIPREEVQPQEPRQKNYYEPTQTQEHAPSEPRQPNYYEPSEPKDPRQPNYDQKKPQEHNPSEPNYEQTRPQEYIPSQPTQPNYYEPSEPKDPRQPNYEQNKPRENTPNEPREPNYEKSRPQEYNPSEPRQPNYYDLSEPKDPRQTNYEQNKPQENTPSERREPSYEQTRPQEYIPSEPTQPNYYEPTESTRIVDQVTYEIDNSIPIRYPGMIETTYSPIPEYPTSPKFVNVYVGHETATVIGAKNEDGSVSVDTKDLAKNEWTKINEKPNCQTGFELDQYGACFDIDECATNRHSCSGLTEVCRNTMGGYLCDCAYGFRRDLLSMACTPVTTSSSTTTSTSTSTTTTTSTSSAPTTSSTRSNFWEYTGYKRPIKRPFKPRSSCDVGYHLNSENGKCEDVDECLNGQANCAAAEICVNTDGGFRCECLPNWRLDSDRHRCVPIRKYPDLFPTGYRNHPIYPPVDPNEIIPGPRGPKVMGEPEITQIEDRGLVFKCPWGTKLGDDQTCEDIDECVTGEAQCGPLQICTNLHGGYTCSCPVGHRLIGDHQCEDIDECAQGGSVPTCSENAECVNSIGSYQCRCHEGFRTAPANDKVCVDVDECSESYLGSLCQQRCNNVWGSYRCSCFRGYRLNADNLLFFNWFSDTAVTTSSGKAFQICIALLLIKCLEGLDDACSNTNIDECETGEAPCSHGSQYKGSSDVCLNTRGGYRCHKITCPQGYQLEHKHRCTKIQRNCPPSDWECAHQPSTYSYNFITFVSNLYIPESKVDLFTMRGPAWPAATMRFQLRVVNVDAPPSVKEKADVNSFLLVQTANQAVMSLVKPLQGLQSIELELSMELYSRGQFGGIAVAKIYIHVSEYEF